MTKKFSKILTGFTFLDLKWGGVYPGGNYLIYGSKKSGKTLLALKIIEQFVQEKYDILFITNERSKTLEIQANSLYFDIHEEVSDGSLEIHKLEKELVNFELIENLVKEKAPSILIIDEIINGNIINHDEYLKILEFLEGNEVTTFFIASISDDDETKKFLRLLAQNSTGIIQLKKNNKKNYSGTITIKPNVGHFEGEFETSYKVEPIKGFVTLADNENSILEFFSENTLTQNEENIEQKFNYSNVYSPDEFKLLINSKIAQGEKNGMQYNLIKFELKEAQIEAVELCNTIKKVLNEGDKISFTDKFVYILPEFNDTKNLKNIISKLDPIVKETFKKITNLEDVITKTTQTLKSNFRIQ